MKKIIFLLISLFLFQFVVPSSAQAAEQYPHFVGVTAHLTWNHYTWADRTKILDRLNAAGVDTIRMDISWKQLQPASWAYDRTYLGFLDRIVDLSNSRKIKPLIIMLKTPTWANGGQPSQVLPTNPATYANAARFLAQRWKGKVAGWQVLNEMNDPDMMATGDPNRYAKFLRVVYPAIKKVDYTTPVIFGGIMYNDANWLNRAYVAGIKGYFDIMATHPYQSPSNTDPTLPDNGTRERLNHLPAIRAVMLRYQDPKPIWLTEFGFSTHANPSGTKNWQLGVSESTQAEFTEKAIREVKLKYSSYVTKMFLYQDRDITTLDFHNNNFGIFRLDLSPKPVYTVLTLINK